MLKILFLVMAVTAFLIPQHALRAEEASPEKTKTSEAPKIPPPKFENLKEIVIPVTVRKVTGPLSFLGDDGTLYTLAGIDVPDGGEESSALPRKAMERLSALIEGKNVHIHVSQKDGKNKMSRLGETFVHAVDPKTKTWIQGQLLSEGFVRVRTTPDMPQLADALLKVESAARKAKAGLWAFPEFEVLTPDTATKDKENAFQIVEGKVLSVASVRNITFLNFGPDWKKDFTIGLIPELRKQLAREKIDPTSLEGKLVRVRGWMRSYNGPYIEPSHPEQMEIIEGLEKYSSSFPASCGESMDPPNRPEDDDSCIPKPIPPTAPSVEAPKYLHTLNGNYKKPETHDTKAPEPSSGE
jgi:micrococcal nuclease